MEDDLISVQPITTTCHEEGCNFTATHVIYVGDEFYGQYCPTHKELQLIYLRELE